MPGALTSGLTAPVAVPCVSKGEGPRLLELAMTGISKGVDGSRTEASTWSLARRLGGEALVEAIVTRTHTCYMGERLRQYEWGHGCGECPACRLRAQGYREFRSRQDGKLPA